MKDPNPEQLELLLKGTIREPSRRFEEALAAIAEQENSTGISWPGMLKPLAVAAALILGISIFLLNQTSPSAGPKVASATTAPLDREWVELFTMSEALDQAHVLTDEDLLPALEYYAFNQ